MTATRMGKGATLALGAISSCVCAWPLTRTSVPALRLSGLDQHRYFSDRAIDRARSFGRGEDALWALSRVAQLAALGVLAWRLPASVRSIGLGRIGTAVIVGMVLLVTLWFVSL